MGRSERVCEILQAPTLFRGRGNGGSGKLTHFAQCRPVMQLPGQLSPGPRCLSRGNTTPLLGVSPEKEGNYLAGLLVTKWAQK